MGSLNDTSLIVLPEKLTQYCFFSCTQSPIPVSLLQLDSSDIALNKLAVDCFLG